MGHLERSGRLWTLAGRQVERGAVVELETVLGWLPLDVGFGRDGMPVFWLRLPLPPRFTVRQWEEDGERAICIMDEHMGQYVAEDIEFSNGEGSPLRPYSTAGVDGDGFFETQEEAEAEAARLERLLNPPLSVAFRVRAPHLLPLRWPLEPSSSPTPSP